MNLNKRAVSRKLLVLPTYIIILLAKPFLPERHPFKKNITLDDWEKHSTKLNDAYSVGFWAFLFLMIYAAYNIYPIILSLYDRISN
jgi:hypothetical protein